MHDFAENIKTDVLDNQATLSSSSNTPTYVVMTNYDKIAVLVFTGARSGGASLTLQLRQRIGAGGTEKNLNTAPTAYIAANGVTVLEANAADLDIVNGYDRIGILITETVGANFVVGAIACRFNTRFGQASLLS